jgi:tol-pal system protein YbgF
MIRFRAVVMAGLMTAISAAPALAAANKEHQQLMAEIRMLQEQQQQLQQFLGTLSDALKAVSAKLDDQAGAMRKAMADEGLAVNGINESVRVLREKVDDTNVRVSSVSQEIEALRQAIGSSQQMTQAPPPVAPGGEAPAAGATAGSTSTPPPASTMNPVSPGVSPQRMFDASFDDYTAGRYDLAIQGFQSYIQAFPRAANAPDAQYNIGQSYYNQSKWKEALDAYEKVISDYPQSPRAPSAYFKLGQTYERLNQIDLAKKAYDTVINSYAESSDAQLARQALERLNRR